MSPTRASLTCGYCELARLRGTGHTNRISSFKLIIHRSISSDLSRYTCYVWLTLRVQAKQEARILSPRYAQAETALIATSIGACFKSIPTLTSPEHGEVFSLLPTMSSTISRQIWWTRRSICRFSTSINFCSRKLSMTQCWATWLTMRQSCCWDMSLLQRRQHPAIPSRPIGR